MPFDNNLSDKSGRPWSSSAMDRAALQEHTQRLLYRRYDMDIDLDLKHGLFFLGGLALGTVGAVVLGRGKLDVKPACAKALSRVLDVRDEAMNYTETVQEAVGDIIAEAQAISSERKSAAEKTAVAG